MEFGWLVTVALVTLNPEMELPCTLTLELVGKEHTTEQVTVAVEPLPEIVLTKAPLKAVTT